ncbi:MAG: STAS domain-containing protein [Akkermansiaceae bacterium]|nr:STAS domain-containing protein [Akkermansiaceae bacterium]
MNSAILKNLADRYIDGGGRLVVVDLAACAGVDSTFMGTLAGIARRLMPAGGGLQVAAPSERVRQSLESLGLDVLMEIDPPLAPWRGQLEQIRSKLKTPGMLVDMGDLDRSRHVLDAHNILSQINTRNEEQFRYVRESLEDEIERKENR